MVQTWCLPLDSCQPPLLEQQRRQQQEVAVVATGPASITSSSRRMAHLPGCQHSSARRPARPHQQSTGMLQ